MMITLISPGRWFDPFNQNVFKGDYPILGQHTFLEVTSQANLDFEGRQFPTQTSGFESTERPFSGNFFGRPNSFFTLDFFSFSLDLFHGTGAFKPVDWRIKLTPTLGVSNFSFSELAQTSPNVLQGTTRTRTFWALQEAFVEYKLADLGPDYDFVSLRAGTQPFNADFRGFLFADINRAIRIFGTNFSNRDQFNLAYFRQWEKDTNTALNTFNDRGQNLFFANYYRQDFLVPGYTAQVSLNYDNDPALDQVRQQPVPGAARPRRRLPAAYGERRLLRLGRGRALGPIQPDPPVLLGVRPRQYESRSPTARRRSMRRWRRSRARTTATGCGTASRSFTPRATATSTARRRRDLTRSSTSPTSPAAHSAYWNRQQIPLQGVNLVQRLSLVPDLRSSKIQGQANFVNPGLILPTFGMDFELTPKLKLIYNNNLIWFDKTSVLQQFLFQGNINSFVGFDIGLGCEYRPLLSENVLFVGGVQMLIPGQGFKDLYNNFSNDVGSLVAGFINAIFTF